MESSGEQKREQPTSRAPRGGLLVMAVIVAVMTLLAVYSNVQKARRAQIETVTITPAAPVIATPSPAAR